MGAHCPLRGHAPSHLNTSHWAPPKSPTTSWDQARNTWGSGDTSGPSCSTPLPRGTVLPTAPALTFDFHFDQFVLRQISQEGNVTVSQAPGTAQLGPCQCFLWTIRGRFITHSLCCGGEIWGHVDCCFVAGNVFSLTFEASPPPSFS